MATPAPGFAVPQPASQPAGQVTIPFTPGNAANIPGSMVQADQRPPDAPQAPGVPAPNPNSAPITATKP